MILQFVLKFWNLPTGTLEPTIPFFARPQAGWTLGPGHIRRFPRWRPKIWNSPKSAQIFFHYWRNHGMWPIISRYFNPIKRIWMIEMHFGTPYSLWGPPRIQDGRHILEMKNDGMWYIFLSIFAVWKNRNSILMYCAHILLKIAAMPAS